MARNISVKVPVATLIANIEAKIAEINEAEANYPSAVEQYERDLEAYKNKVTEFVSDYLSKNTSKVGYDHDSVIRITNNHYSNKLELTFDTDVIGLPKRPEQPTRPNQTTYYGRDYTTQKQLLERNLKILRMTTQEEVNASTYGAVMELL